MTLSVTEFQIMKLVSKK